MARFGLLLLLLSAGVVAHGKAVLPAAVRDVQVRAPLIINELLNSNVREVGGVDLEALKENLPVIRWRSIQPGEKRPNFVGSRSSAYYIRNGKNVTLISDPREYSQSSIDVLSVHESLGALGYNDINYERSMAIVMIKEISNLEARDFIKYSMEIRKDEAKFTDILQSSIGGTSVGGGGDLVAITIKLAVYDYFIHTFFRRTSFDLMLSAMAVEPNYDPNISSVQYTLEPSETWIGAEHRSVPTPFVKAVKLPSLVWTNGTNEQRQALIQEVVSLILKYEKGQVIRQIFKDQKDYDDYLKSIKLRAGHS